MHIVQFTVKYSELSETFLYDITRQLEHRGHRVTNVTMSKIDRYRPITDTIQLRQSGSIRNTMAKGLLKLTGNTSYLYYQYLVSFRKSLKDTLAELKPDVVLCQFGFMGVVAMPVCRDLGIPVVVQFHGHDIAVYPRSGFWHLQYRKWLPKAALLLGNSAYTMGKLVRYAASLDHLGMVHMGIDPEKLPYSDPTARMKGNIVRCLHVGRLVEKKGPLLLLEAFIQARKQLWPATDLRMTIIGEGPLIDQVTAFVSEHELDRIVDVPGGLPHEAVLAHIADSHIYTQHSITASDGDEEGQGVSPAEASCAGLPVVLTNHNGFPDVVEDGITGFLVSERNTTAMAERIVWLAHHPEEMRTMGLAGREKMLAEFTQADQAKRLEKYLVDVTSLKFSKEATPSPLERAACLPDRQGVRPRTLVVLTTANQAVFTQRAIASLRTGLPADADLLMVDDASADITLPWLDAMGVRTIRKERPMGLTHSWNLAYRAFVDGDYEHLVLSNNDVLFPPGALEALVHCLGPERWIAGPLGTPTGVGHQPLQSVLQYFNPPLNLDDPSSARNVQAYLEKQPGPEHVPMPYINGFCFALHRDIQAIELVSGHLFDEQRINVANEDDLCARAGGRIVCALKSFVYHYKGASFLDFVLSDGYQLDRNLTWKEAASLNGSLVRQWSYRIRRKLANAFSEKPNT